MYSDNKCQKPPGDILVQLQNIQFQLNMSFHVPCRLLDTPAERERNGSQYALHAVETAQLFCGNLPSFYGTVMLRCTGKKRVYTATPKCRLQ